MLARRATLFSVFLLASCNLSTGDMNEVKADQSASAGVAKKDFFKDGFTIKIEKASSGAKGDVLVLEDAQGKVLNKDELPSAGLSLDRSSTPEGDIIFAWPKASEVINRNFERVGELMKEYGALVGTMIGSNPVGKGAESWAQYLRSEQGLAVDNARLATLALAKKQSPFEIRKVSNAWCGEVVNQFVNGLVPSGSAYRQYGNCGEGGQIGACLAMRAGFQENEIRVCSSMNDHFFAMVKRGVENGVDHRWCILDRWPDGPMQGTDSGSLIGNFTCGIDIDESAHQVTINGELVPGEMTWFQRASCTTIDDYLTNQDEFYSRVSQIP